MKRIVLALACWTVVVVAGCESLRRPSAKSATLLDAKTTPAIVLPVAPTAAESFAARELQTYLQKMTGQTVTITNTVRASSGPSIVLGAHPLNQSLHWESLTPDQYVIDVSASRVRIAGGRALPVQDAQGKVHVQERGTLYGVYELLESLGVRWYRPDPWGEHVPQLDRIQLPVGRQTYRPAYKYRYGINGYRWWKDETMEQRARARLWATRNRQNANMWTGPEYGGYYQVNFAHNYMYFIPPERYFAAHPEYFALMDGKRVGKRGAEATQLCLSNPEVQRLMAEAVVGQAKGNPQIEVVSVEPNDGDLWCECDACNAMDDPKLLGGFGGVSRANRVCAFNNIVARKVAEQAPQVKIGWLAYSTHTEVPTLVTKLEPNTVVMATAYAGAYSDYTRTLDDPASVQNARFLKILQGYGKLTQIFAHDYFGGYAWFGPLPIVHTMEDRLRAYRRHGVVGVYSQSDAHWGPQGLTLYMYCRLLWNPDLDVAQELDLYYPNYYGPAARPMKNFHELLERAAEGGPYFGSGGSGILRLFADDLVQKLGVAITEARDTIQDQQPYARRLEGVWAGYEFARRFHQAAKLKAENRVLEADRELQELEQFVLSYKGGEVFGNGPSPCEAMDSVRAFGKEIREQAQLLSAFKNPQIVQTHDKQWRFQIDPKDQGLVTGWMKTDFDATPWPLLDADRWWQEQGYPNYHGVAWYRRQFQPPAREGAQRIVLYFGAVDGDTTVFVNGQKVGEHILPPNGVGWDKPFYFDITDHLQPGHPNLIAVRVKDEVAMSGIFKGVKLVRVDTVEPASAK